MATRVTRLFDVANPRRVVLISGAHGANEFFSVALPAVLPLLVADLDITYAEAGALVTVFFVMYTVFQPIVGVLADGMSKRRLIVGGTVVLSIGMALAGLAQSYPVLVASQVLAGIGGSTYHPSGMSLLSDIEKASTEGKAMGMHSLGGIIGTMLAPVIIGGIAAVADWRSALLVAGSLGFLYALAFAFAFDTPSVVTDVQSDTPSVRVLREQFGDIVRNVGVSLPLWVLGLVAAKLLFSLQFGAVRTYTTSYIFTAAGDSTSVANVVFFVLLGGGAVASLYFGNLADRFNRGKLLAGTFFLSAVLLAVTAVIPPNPVLLLGWFFLIGVAIYGGLPVMNTLVSQYSERGSSGSLFGVVQTASAMGSAGAPLLFGAVSTRVGIETAFPAIAAVSVVGGVVLVAFALTVFR